MNLLKVGCAALNQTPLAWSENLEHVLEAIAAAKSDGTSLVCLPELALSGYGCEDMFFAPSLAKTVEDLLCTIRTHTKGIAVAVGLPLRLREHLYNAACLLADGEIVGFAAKRFLAGDGIHYEPRWFRPWPAGKRISIEICGASYPLGTQLFELDGITLAFEICRDAWIANRPGAQLAAAGVDIFLNPSASHFAFGKYEIRKRFVLEGSRAFGSAYVYCNLLGNESGRAIYDGDTLIASGGRLLAAGERFSYSDVSFVSAVIDVEENRLKRAHLHSSPPDQEHAPESAVPRTVFPFSFPSAAFAPPKPSAPRWERSEDLKKEEFGRAVALGLFDYLRKSRAKGFVVSLSGGADSSATSVLVWLMARLAITQLGEEGVRARLATAFTGAPPERSLMESLLVTVYQGTRNSSVQTRTAARQLAAELGAIFYECSIDTIVDQYRSMCGLMIGDELDWQRHDAVLQNIQARARAPLAWMLANFHGALLLTTSNRSEAAVGYTTMDGDSAGGLSPIGGIDKAFLLDWLRWMKDGGCQDAPPVKSLHMVLSRPPTAELRPPEANQTDEADLMPYPMLDAIERLAVRDKMMPREIFERLRAPHTEYSDKVLVVWIERFFTLWSRNQWKRERYAPSFHLDDENLDPKTWFRFPILSGGFAHELEALRAMVQT